MALSEFELIKKYFSDKQITSSYVTLGIGDDGAILNCPPAHELIVSTDILNEGVHFYPQSSAHYVGFKSLAVNLSDLAAMGATPNWFTLNLSLPEVDENWLQEFSRGLHECAQIYDVHLVGGDTTRGALSIGIQVGGYVPSGQAILRSGAQPGDRVFISGALGNAAYINKQLLDNTINYDTSLEKYLIPTPQIPLGISLRGIANSAIDISDGLLADISHVTYTSHCGAKIFADKIPFAEYLKDHETSTVNSLQLACTGGEDYVICFTVAEHKLPDLKGNAFYKSLHEIGVITGQDGVMLLDENNNEINFQSIGYDHFKAH